MKIDNGDLTYCQIVVLLGAAALVWQFFGFLMGNQGLSAAAALNAVACACCVSTAFILQLCKRPRA